MPCGWRACGAKKAFYLLPVLSSNAGKKTRFVNVAITSVREVSHPRACVPPNPLKQKMTNPAISTNEV
jgi:hypothetical protein